MTAAAFAEAGAPELAEEMLSRAGSEAGRAPAQTAPGEGVAAAGTLKVLLVDDEEDFVTTVADRMAMRKLGSEVALSGEAALTILEQDVPDVVVLDLRMPGMSGMEVLRKLKASHPQVEVIIMTGHGSEEDEQEALRLGAFAYLQKPVEIDQLVRRVRQAGRRRQGEG